MPRWASRLTLRIKDIRVGRLQNILEVEAVAEGIEHSDWRYSCEPYRNYQQPKMALGKNCSLARTSFSTLWDSINGKPRKDGTDVSWKANPFVWIVEFSVIKKNVDEWIEHPEDGEIVRKKT